MVDDPAKPTMTGTKAFGCDAESVVRVGRPSRSCRIGWCRPGTTACVADTRRVNVSPQVIPLSKQRRTAKIRRACPIHALCADGRNGDC